MKKFYLVLVLILAIALLCSCSAGSKEMDYAPESPSVSEATQNDYNIVITEDRLLVYTANVSVTVKDISSAQRTISQKLDEFGGYLSNSSRSNNGYMSCTYRVPTIHLQEFLNCIEGTGDVNITRVSSDDITERYTNAVRQRDALQAEYDAIYAILQRANENPSTTLETIADLTSRLQRLASQIDGYNSSISGYKKQADYSTVELSMYGEETYEEPSFWSQLGDILSGSTSSVGKLFGVLLIIIVALLPYIGVAVVGFGLYCLVKFIVCRIKHVPFTLFARSRERRAIRRKMKENERAKIKEKLGM